MTLASRPVDVAWEEGVRTLGARWLDTERCGDRACGDGQHEYGRRAAARLANLGRRYSARSLAARWCLVRTPLDVPCLHDWSEVGLLRFDRATVLEEAAGDDGGPARCGARSLLHGMTDFHGATRSPPPRPVQLNLDMVERGSRWRRCCQGDGDVFRIYDFFYDKLTAAGRRSAPGEHRLDKALVVP